MTTVYIPQELLAYIKELEESNIATENRVAVRLKSILDLEFIQCSVCKGSTGKPDGQASFCGNEKCSVTFLCDKCVRHKGHTTLCPACAK